MKDRLLNAARKMAFSALPILVALSVAFLLGALLLRAAGESPAECYTLIIRHALLSRQGWASVLYLGTLLTFVGLAVALPLRSGLFNIGGEGQIYAGCLGCVAVGLTVGGWRPWLAVPLCLAAGAGAGALCGAVPGWLRARRGVHEVITTILLNFCIIAWVNYLTNGPMKDPGDGSSSQMMAQTRLLPSNCFLPTAAQLLPGLVSPSSPFNASTLLALILAAATWGLLTRTRTGFFLRSVRKGRLQVRLAGADPERLTMLSMSLAGGIAGLVASSEVMGFRHRLLDNFSGGIGYQGIAVALLARCHPLWVPVAALFFGFLQKGCSILDVYTNASKEIALVLQAVVTLSLVAFEGIRQTRSQGVGPKKIPFLRGKDIRKAETP